MTGKKWTIFNVPYGGGYGPLNLAKPKGTRRAPRALKREFNRQSIFIADNGVSSWRDVLWEDISFSYWLQNSIDKWNQMEDKVLGEVFNVYICGYQDQISKSGYDGKFLFLGGSHSITAATYAAIARINERKNTGLVLLDAHPDCCDKSNWPIHSDWLRWLVAKDEISPQNILIIGLRQVEKEEKEFLERNGISHFSMDFVRRNIRDFNSFMHNTSIFLTLEKLRKLDAIYLSIDIDIASGVFAPGTGCPSPGGFTDAEIISLVKQLKIALPNLVAFDIVEINPLNWWRKRILRYDATVDLGVKLIKEIVS